MTDFQPPSDELPGVLALARILGSTETASLFTTAAFVFSTGMKIEFGLREQGAYVQENAHELYSQLVRPGDNPPIVVTTDDPTLSVVADDGRSVNGAFNFAVWISPLPTETLSIFASCSPLKLQGNVAVDVNKIRDAVAQIQHLY